MISISYKLISTHRSLSTITPFHKHLLQLSTPLTLPINYSNQLKYYSLRHLYFKAFTSISILCIAYYETKNLQANIIRNYTDNVLPAHYENIVLLH